MIRRIKLDMVDSAIECRCRETMPGVIECATIRVKQFALYSGTLRLRYLAGSWYLLA